MRAFLVMGLLSALAGLGPVACTGDQADEDQPAVSTDAAAAPEGGEDSAAAEPAEAKAFEGEPGAGPDAMDAAQPGNTADALGVEEPPAKALPPPAFEPAPVPVTQAPPKAPGKKKGLGAAPTDSHGRVVRYVRAASVDIHGQASEGAPAVGHLAKGDIVMVIQEGTWGKIADNMYVKLSELSTKAVPRPVGKEATWQAPKG